MRRRARAARAGDALPQQTAMGTLNHIIAVEEGVTILHTAVDSLANGPSMPSTKMAVDNMRRLGHEVAIDESRLDEVSDHLAALARGTAITSARRWSTAWPRCSSSSRAA